jgi:two-component system, chemotaxis family, CheB/CheR fusion protein
MRLSERLQQMPALSIAQRELDDANRVQAAAALKVAVLRCAETQAGAMYPEMLLNSVDPACRPMPNSAVWIGAATVIDSRAIVFIVDHDPHVRSALRRLLEANGLRAEAFADGEAFLNAYERQDNACLLADTALRDLGGLALLLKLGAADDPMPVIMITESSDIRLAVSAMKAGAVDFIEKPLGGAELIASVLRALETGRAASGRAANRTEALHHFEALTPRQRQIMILVLSGHPSKNIAADLGISQRTVENHRAAIMRKSGSKSLPALARLAFAAGESQPN